MINPDAIEMWINGRQVRVDFAHEHNGRIHFETEGGGDYSFDAAALMATVKAVRRRDRRRK